MCSRAQPGALWCLLTVSDLGWRVGLLITFQIGGVSPLLRGFLDLGCWKALQWEQALSGTGPPAFYSGADSVLHTFPSLSQTQLERCRAVIPARKLKAGLGVGASSRPLAALGSQAQLRWLSAPPPKLVPPKSWEEQILRSSSEKSRGGQWVHGVAASLLQPPRSHLGKGASGTSVAFLPGADVKPVPLIRTCPGPVPRPKGATSC